MIKRNVSKFTFPVKCDYRGGIEVLGKHGKRLWIQERKVGHGEFRLTHSIPLSEVHSVEVTERVFGQTDVQIRDMPGLPLDRHVRGTAPSTSLMSPQDGHQALWTIENRSSDWVRERLQPSLSEAGIRFYDDLLPNQRPNVS